MGYQDLELTSRDDYQFRWPHTAQADEQLTAFTGGLVGLGP